MIVVFYVFASALIWFSYRSFIGGIRYRKFFSQELRRPRSAFTPFASIIAPCCGCDEGLSENLASLFEQDYPEYEIIFAVESVEDASIPVIRQAMAGAIDSGVTAKIVVARAAAASSQKVENLREAVINAHDRSSLFAFVDSDVRPSRYWLRGLAAPLADDAIGASTGYRWFISRRMSFGSEMRSVWNASIASALGSDTRTNFAWGGSMAMRRSDFDRLGVREAWVGTLSDDFSLTRVVREAGLGIAFVPAALTASLEHSTLREMLEFTTRQMKITRVCMPRLWLMSFFGSALFNAGMIAALLLVLRPSASAETTVAAITLGLVAVFSIGKAWLRLKAVEMALPRYRRELGRQFWTQNTLWLLSPPVFLYNSLAALLSRRITWRGKTYELKSPTETVIIRA